MNLNKSIINEIFTDANNDPLLCSKLDINNIIGSINDEKHGYLINKNLKSIAHEIVEKLHSLKGIIADDIPIFCDKLKDYFLVTNLTEFRKSHNIKYIKKGDTKLQYGGFLLDIKPSESGFNLLLLTFGKRIIQVKLNDCIFFQKLSDDEKLILISLEYLEKFEKNIK